MTVKKWQRLWESKMAGSFLWETDKEAEAFSCKKRIDLKGRLMLPGFVDTHMHMLHYAFVERSVKLFDCTSVEEMLAAAKKDWRRAKVRS